MERNCKAGQNPPRVVAPIEEEKDNNFNDSKTSVASAGRLSYSRLERHAEERRSQIRIFVYVQTSESGGSEAPQYGR